MTELATQAAARPPQAVLRERCTALGFPTWRFSSASQVIHPPGENGIVGVWLRAPAHERLVTEVVRRWAKEESPAIVEAYPGFWLVPLVETFRKKRNAYTVVIVLCPPVLEAEQFELACQSASLDARATRDALLPCTNHDVMNLERVKQMLEWTRDDLEEIRRSSIDVRTVSQQLTESYEEISLLYTLGQSMNELLHPENFVEIALEELRNVLPFKWIVARFSSHTRVARHMAGHVLISGELPCDRTSFDLETGLMVGQIQESSAQVLSHEARGPLGRGASQLLVQPIMRSGEIVGAIFVGDKRGDDRQISNVDINMVEAAAGYIGILLDNAFLYDDQQAMFVGTLEALTAAIDAKDPYTCGHSERVARLAAALAREIGMSEAEVERVRIAGLVHDIGKIGVPESVLCKAGRLTEEEFELIKQHPVIGYDILKGVPMLEDVLPGVLYHHERFDGRGYPEGLNGKNVPLVAAIIGLADAFDAMSSNRTYRPAMPRDRVLAEISRNAGTQFEPSLVPAFVGLDFSVFDDLVMRHQLQATQGGLRTRRRGTAA